MRKRCIALYSGGLDSILATRLMQQQGVEVVPLHFVTPFFGFELLADPQSDEIIAAVVGYLSSRGSISRAAETLGVHRNTVQARVRRAEELGLPLGEPDKLLSSFMMLAALQGGSVGRLED